MTSPSQSLLLSDLQQLLEGEEHTDVVLLAKGGQRIPAHSIILAARSEYFRSLLHGGLSESLATSVPLQVEATALRSLLAYLYTSRPGLATLTIDTLFHLLDTARMMCLTDLQARVEEHITQTVLEPGTLIHIFNLAVELKFPDITDICLRDLRDSLEKDPSLSSLSPMAMVLVLEDTYIVHFYSEHGHSLLSSWLQLYQWQGLEEQQEFLTNVQQLLVPDFLEKMKLAGLLVLLEMATSVEVRRGQERSGLGRRVREALVRREEVLGREERLDRERDLTRERIENGLLRQKQMSMKREHTPSLDQMNNVGLHYPWNE